MNKKMVHCFAITLVASVFWHSEANADAFLFTGPSKHSDPGYYEHNSGVCYEDADIKIPDRFLVGCIYKDSHKENAVAVALGRRWPIMPYVKAGVVAGFSLNGTHDKQSPNATGQHDKALGFGGYAGALATIGTDAVALQMVYFPEIASTPAVRWLQLRIGLN